MVTSVNSEYKKALLRLARSKRVNSFIFQTLLRKYKSPEIALDHVPELTRRGGDTSPPKVASKQSIDQEWKKTHDFGANFLFLGDANYPELLAKIENPPPVLTYIGFLDLLHKESLAIVGGRNSSLNSQKLAKRFAEVIGENGFVVASGMARGIDRAAHLGALETGTIGIIAGGINEIYPKDNQDLFDAVKKRGLLLAESAFGTRPFAGLFPRRNRIITGLSRGVLVLEASLKSGTMLSAEIALEQGKDVFAVPGSPLDERHRGCHKLIQDGAYLTERPDDIFDNLKPLKQLESLATPFAPSQFATDISTLDLSMSEEPTDQQRQTLFAYLGDSPVSIDELIVKTGFSASVMVNIILELELAQRVERLPGNRVVRLFNGF